jgi:hypothetical protein
MNIWPDSGDGPLQVGKRSWLRALFSPPDATSVMEQQLASAQRDLAQHAALTEYHAAMRDMLRDRCLRLVGELRDA